MTRRSFKNTVPYLFGQQSFLTETVASIVSVFRNSAIQKIVCIEGNSFIIAALVANKMGLDLVPVYKHLPNSEDLYSLVYTDITGSETHLAIHSEAVSPGQTVALITDIVETGITVKAVTSLLDKIHADVQAVHAVFDMSTPGFKHQMSAYSYSYTLDSLPETIGQTSFELLT